MVRVTGLDVVTCPVLSVATAESARPWADETLGAGRLRVALGPGFVTLMFCVPRETTIEATPRSSDELTVTGIVLPARNVPETGEVMATVGDESVWTVTGTVTGPETWLPPSSAVNERAAGPIAAVVST